MLNGMARSANLVGRKTRTMRWTRRLAALPGAALTYGWLLLISVFCAGPFIWILSTSFKGRDEVFTKVPVLVPQAPTLAAYQYILTKTLAPRYFLNSLIIASGTTVQSN